jgi:hypothetical protein
MTENSHASSAFSEDIVMTVSEINVVKIVVPNKDPGSSLEQGLAHLVEAGPAAIESRLRELDREWSIGRMIKAACGVVILCGLPLALFVHPWFAVAPALGGLVLAQYLFAKRSWLSEPFHELGFRTGCEIDQEKVALKALRGDFRNLPTLNDIEDQDAIARLEGEGGIVVETSPATYGPLEAAKEVVEATRP